MHWWNNVEYHEQFPTESFISPADDSALSVVQTSCFPGRVKSFWCGYSSPGGRFSRAGTCCSPTPWVEEECWRWETFCSRAGRPARSRAESETGREQVRENCGAGRMLLLQNWDLYRQPWRCWCLASPTERLATGSVKWHVLVLILTMWRIHRRNLSLLFGSREYLCSSDGSVRINSFYRNTLNIS